LSLARPIHAQEQVALVPFTNEAYRIQGLIPDGWTNAGPGLYARGSGASDVTLLALQSAPVRAEQLWPSLLPQFNLRAVPDSTGTVTTDHFDWTLYAFDVSAGDITLHIALALSEVEGTTYLTLLQAAPTEYDALYESVFTPVLDAYAPLVEARVEVPYRVEDITFDSGDITLAGTLTLPPANGRHPAVVLVSGSGPQDRDETLPGIAIRPFRLIADALTRAGIAVLRYDDRGVAESGGDFETATTDDFAADAAAAIAYLLTRDDIDPDQIGLLGHSEGGLVAAKLGASSEDLDFIISVAGPGVTGAEVLILQNRLIVLAEGGTEEDAQEQAEFIETLIPLIGSDRDAAFELTFQQVRARLEELPESQRAAIGDLDAYAREQAAAQLESYSAAWFAAFLAYDPRPDWAQTTIPVLAIFGGKDVQVDAGQNAPALEAALTEAGNADFTIVSLPDANHLFQAADTGAVSEYATLASEFTPDFLPTILDWLLPRVDVVE
jgi:pimeloyl-ACP methyl ester carboxylesterase